MEAKTELKVTSLPTKMNGDAKYFITQACSYL
jgi:hypothetical protein